MDFRRKNLKVRTQYNNFKFSRTFLALVAYYYARRAAIARLPVLKKSAVKFKMLYRVLTLRFFLLKWMLLMYSVWKYSRPQWPH